MTREKQRDKFLKDRKDAVLFFECIALFIAKNNFEYNPQLQSIRTTDFEYNLKEVHDKLIILLELIERNSKVDYIKKGKKICGQDLWDLGKQMYETLKEDYTSKDHTKLYEYKKQLAGIYKKQLAGCHELAYTDDELSLEMHIVDWDDLKKKHGNSQDAFLGAVKAGLGGVVKLAAKDENVNIDTADKDGDVALRMAVVMKSVTMVETLLSLSPVIGISEEILEDAKQGQPEVLLLLNSVIKKRKKRAYEKRKKGKKKTKAKAFEDDEEGSEAFPIDMRNMGAQLPVACDSDIETIDLIGGTECIDYTQEDRKLSPQPPVVYEIA